MSWYIDDLARFKAERERIEKLGQGCDWLKPLGWRFDEFSRPSFHAEIIVGENVYAIVLRYPALFPQTPPSIFPRDQSALWSDHQFGPGGELCLEFGPDNWTPDLTGAHMLESAHRLLEGERPAAGGSGEVASRHETTLGQQLRLAGTRLLLTLPMEAVLQGAGVGEIIVAKTVNNYREPITILTLETLTFSNGSTWRDSTIPARLSEECWITDSHITRIDDDAVLPSTDSADALRADCAKFGLPANLKCAVILKGKEIHAYRVSFDQSKAFKIAVIPVDEHVQRLDRMHELLQSKSVALIGCGSMGSKVATMLARSGVNSFLLIDDDVMLPGNMVRNDLDWRDAGVHKAQAMANRIMLVNPLATVQTRMFQIAGQESSAGAESAMNQIVACDMIIDATANPIAFNLVAAVSGVAKKPVLWGEVFGGGFGGLIARCRPGIEPSSQYMRRAIENWFASKDAPLVRPGRRYDTNGQQGSMVADDADVTFIGSALARMAIDLLIGRDPSFFLHSAYAVGMGQGSVFSQAFDTHPIDISGEPPAAESAQLSPEEERAELKALVEMYTKIDP